MKYPEESEQQLLAADRHDFVIPHSNSNPFWKSSLLGAVLASAFLGTASLTPESSPLHRYFLGHPIAIAATTLFSFAVAILMMKSLWLSGQKRQCETLRDEDLLPDSLASTPAEIWNAENNLNQVARNWLKSLNDQPHAIANNLLMGRLKELIHRQVQRRSSKLLADDLRELSIRDADAAHDSYGLVRIISWAIPMLGFLGTVIGITQTLGGLDFSDGTTAVENLKSGLYVAFDTTAVGLVLSVLAIFLQFPIERSEQKFLAVIDARVGNLASSCLPSDGQSENQTDLVANLLEGIQVAVSESLEQQAKLWRQTISEAQKHWQHAETSHAEQISRAIEQVLSPAILQHAETSTSIAESFNLSLVKQSEQLEKSFRGIEESACQSFDNSHQQLSDRLGTMLAQVAVDHQNTIQETAKSLQERHLTWTEQQMERDSKSRDHHAKDLSRLQTDTQSLLTLQQTLDTNLQRIQHTNTELNRQVSNDLSANLTEAMRYLARTVDHLSTKLDESTKQDQATRSAA